MATDGPAYSCLVQEEPYHFSWRKLWSFMGPGLLMSIAYVDPGNLESDLQVGATAGYSLLWLMLVSTILGFIIQMEAAKLGLVTGKHLAEHCRAEYPPVPSKVLWLMIEIAIIGSDIQEVIGSAIAIAVLSRGAVPLWVGVVVSAVGAFLLLLVERWGVRLLEAMFAFFIGVMVITFGVMYFDMHVPGLEVLRGFVVPYISREAIPTGVALVGSLIMPHNIYLHSALVQSRRLSAASDAEKKDAMRYIRIECALSLGASVVINMFVTAVFAKSFWGQDLLDIGLENAGAYLLKEYGPTVMVIWGLGLLAAGQSSSITGTYTGQFVMEGFLDISVPVTLRVAITRLVAIAPALLVALLYRSSTGLDALNQGLNVLQSVQLPFALIPVLALTSEPRLMGSFATRGWRLAGCWTIAALVISINIAGVMSFVQQNMQHASPLAWALVVGSVVAYFAFVVYLLLATGRVRGLLRTFSGFLCHKPGAPGALPVSHGVASLVTPRRGDVGAAGGLQQPLLLSGVGSVGAVGGAEEEVAGEGKGALGGEVAGAPDGTV